MADDRKPMANIPPFGLRMQPSLKARVEEAARANNRSLNAEIVSLIEYALEERDHAARVHQEFVDEDGRQMTLEDVLRNDIAHQQRILKSLMQDRVLEEDRTLYVALDADGMPLSWQEIMTHLGEIGRAGNFDIQKIEAHIVDVASASNSERESQWWDLVQRYRKLRKKR